MYGVDRAYAIGDVAYDILAILWDGPRPRFGIVRAVAEDRGVRADPRTIDRILSELEADAFVTARDVHGEIMYSIADRGSDALARSAP